MSASVKHHNQWAACWLWFAWVFLFGAGMFAHIAQDMPFAEFASELKVGSSIVLVVFSWLSARSIPPATRPVAVLVALAMTLGCLGDASPLLGSVWPDPQRTIGNMILFGLGHIAYIRACAIIRDRNLERCPITIWYGSLAVWLMIGCVLWYFAAAIGPLHTEMKVPALGYTLLLSGTAGVTFGYGICDRRYISVAIGSILFLISDVLLAIWIFHDVVYQSFDLVWLNYGIGQMLIVFGTAYFQHKSPR